MNKRVICAASIFAVIFCFCFTSFAHPGRTDSKGGHYDHSTGEYHYHHGYPAHQHTNGVCPYDFEDKTGKNSGENITRTIEIKKKEVKKEMEVDDIISYCVTTNFPSFIAFPIAIFMARFGKPKEWAWAWFGIGVSIPALILYYDYNSESFAFSAAIEAIISAISIFLILKMYKLRKKRGFDIEEKEKTIKTTKHPKEDETQNFSISERDYQRAMRITNLSVHSKEIKEIAKVMGKTPKETMEYFYEIIRNYNLKRYSKKGDRD